MAKQLLEPPLVVDFGKPDMMVMILLLIGIICLLLSIQLINLLPKLASQIMQTIQLFAVVSVFEDDFVQAVSCIKFGQNSIILLYITFHHFSLVQLLSVLSNIICI